MEWTADLSLIGHYQSIYSLIWSDASEKEGNKGIGKIMEGGTSKSS